MSGAAKGKPVFSRGIFGVYTDPVLARDHADTLREMGRHPRVYRRMARAENTTAEVSIVVADVENVEDRQS